MPNAMDRIRAFAAGRPAWQVAVLLAMLTVASVALPVRADDSLAERIDRAIEAAQVVPPAAPASDAEFIRRASLDLIGRIPSAAEARAFFTDHAPEKRAALIDRLLASPEYPRHISGVFDVMLMERRPQKNVPVAEWQQYLYDSFVANKPYDQLVREILSVDGVDPAERPRARFYLDREGEPNLLARDVGRIFLGMDLQCAQCHDHPLISSYYQADYQGLYAFFNRSTLFTTKDQKVYLAEKADGDVAYQSVFDASRKGTALPTLPSAQPLSEPSFIKGDEYVVAPADNVRPVPKYSRRARLAKELTASQHRQFDRTIVNRLWAHMMGRGLIDPVDLDHTGNPAAHPAVLDLLADAFPQMKYDVRALLAQLARTRAYARAIDISSPEPQQASQLAPRSADAEAERARLIAAVETSQAAAAKAAAELETARAAAAPVAEELSKSRIAVLEAQRNAAKATADVAAAQAALPSKKEVATLVANTSAKASQSAAQLPNDKELADAAAKLKTRSDQLAGEVAALEKTIAEGPAVAKTTADALSAAQQAPPPIEARLAPLNARIIELVAAQKVADSQAQADRAALAATIAWLDDSRALIAFSEAQSGVESSRAVVAKAETDMAAARAQLNSTTADGAQHAAAVTACEQAATAAQQALAAQQAALDQSRQQLIDRASTRCAIALLKHLTPEQLAWSMMQASGVVDRERAGVEAEWTKNHPTPDEAAQAARPREIAQALNEKLKPSVQAFVSLFAAGPGQPQQSFQATVDQALFLANGGQVRSWLAPADGNLTDRVVKLADPQQAADELYLNVLSRTPTSDEAAEVGSYLANRAADRAAAVQELAWALFCSAEFRFNH